MQQFNEKDNLKNNNKIEIYSNIKNDELSHINTLNENTTLIIINNSNSQKEYTKDLYRIINKYYKLNKNFKLLFEIEHRKQLYDLIEILKKCKDKNINIICDHIKYPINEYLKENEKLENIVRNIKTSNMSPLEKYFAIYNIVKKYKPYKENEDNLKQARKIKYILDNEYIVCVGYSNLLIELLNRVGIEACDYSTSIYDYKTNKKEGHARTIVNIIDNKYNVNGYYIADPTWDNHLNKYDTYIYALRPFCSMQKSEDCFQLVTSDYILDNKDFNEFCIKVNIYLNKRIYNGSNLLDSYNSIFYVITKLLEEIDIKKYNELKNYIDIPEYERKEQFYEKFLTEIGHYIVEKSNKEINPNIIAKATSQAKFYNENIPNSFIQAYANKVIKEYADYNYEIKDEKLIEKQEKKQHII